MQQYGIKAASLLYLQELGLFQKKMFVLPKLISEDEFFSLMEKNGFKDIAFGIRFSPKSPLLGIKSKHNITSWQEGYRFFRDHLYQGAAIIQEHTDPKYMGTLHFGDEKITVNLVPGTWASSAWDSCDIMEIGEKIDYYRYMVEREALYGSAAGFVPRKVAPFTIIQVQQFIDLFKGLLPKLEQLFKKGRMLEFIIDRDLHFLGMEFKESADDVTFLPKQAPEQLFVIKDFSDLAFWDKKQDVLISLKLGRNISSEFLPLLSEIKKYKSSVYVKYGLLSHPAILIREQGLETKQYFSDYGHMVFER